MRLSIIIPVYNEEKTIAKVLKTLLNLSSPQIDKEIIVIDDGSVDATKQILKKIKDKKIKIIYHTENRGKGTAVRTGIGHASGEYILIQDADLEYDPNDILKLALPLKEKNVNVVYGSRLKRLPNFSRDERTVRFFLHYLGNKFLSFLTSILYGQWITDMETGYKLFSKKSVNTIVLRSKSFDFEPEITAKFLKKGYRIYEVPITTNPRGYSEGKKLNTFRDGLIALWTLLKYRVVD